MVRIRLLGEELALKTDQDPDEVRRVAADLDERLRRLAAELNLHSQPTRLALLAGLELAGELRDLEARGAAAASGTTAAVEALIRRIEHALTLDPD